MTMNQATKAWSSWDGILVPAAGEIVVDKQTNKMKIGDGITEFADLPYVESTPTETTLSKQAKQFIEDNIEYLDINDYESFYSHITTVELAREVSKALFRAGLNPKAHLKKCPRGCESIFYYEGKDEILIKVKDENIFWDMALKYHNFYRKGQVEEYWESFDLLKAY